MQREFEVQSITTSVSARSLRMPKTVGTVTRIRGRQIEACPCPGEGLADVYCTPDPFDVPNNLAMELTGDCTWCGVSAGAEDEAQQYDLSIIDDFFGDGVCGWALSVAEGSLILFKAWDDGDPVGEYTDGAVIVTTVSDCGSEEAIPCE